MPSSTHPRDIGTPQRASADSPCENTISADSPSCPIFLGLSELEPKKHKNKQTIFEPTGKNISLSSSRAVHFEQYMALSTSRVSGGPRGGRRLAPFRLGALELGEELRRLLVSIEVSDSETRGRSRGLVGVQTAGSLGKVPRGSIGLIRLLCIFGRKGSKQLKWPPRSASRASANFCALICLANCSTGQSHCSRNSWRLRASTKRIFSRPLQSTRSTHHIHDTASLFQRTYHTHILLQVHGAFVPVDPHLSELFPAHIRVLPSCKQWNDDLPRGVQTLSHLAAPETIGCLMAKRLRRS